MGRCMPSTLVSVSRLTLRIVAPLRSRDFYWLYMRPFAAINAGCGARACSRCTCLRPDCAGGGVDCGPGNMEKGTKTSAEQFAASMLPRHSASCRAIASICSPSSRLQPRTAQPPRDDEFREKGQQQLEQHGQHSHMSIDLCRSLLGRVSLLGPVPARGPRWIPRENEINKSLLPSSDFRSRGGSRHERSARL